MTPDKWARLKDIFQQAVELRPDSRQTFVASIRERDPSLAEELVSLLAAQSAETGVLDHPPADLMKKALDQHKGDQPAGALQPGQVIGDRYEIVDLLGVGGFGRVYTALDRRVDNRKVVLKVVIPPANTEEWSERRFEDEVRSLARVDHPGIVRVYDSGRLDEGYRYLVMQYIAGNPLDGLLKAGPLNLDRGLKLIQQIADSLGEAHAAGILHRDLKPANVIIRDSGQPNERAVLIDFGIARTGVDTGSEVHTAVMSGSPAYMAPEQFYGRTSPASDVFSLGSTAFEMLRGIPLHKCGATEMMQRTARVELGQMQPPVPEPVREAIAKALAPDPDQRFQSAREFGKAVGEAAPASASASTVTETLIWEPPPATPPARSRRGLMWGVLGMVFTLGLIYFTRDSEKPTASAALELHASLSRRSADGRPAPYISWRQLARGDQLEMVWESPQAAYLYVFDESSDNGKSFEYTLLFPGEASQTPLTPGRQQRLPEARDQWLKADGFSPHESILVVLSKKPIEELEGLRKFSKAPAFGALDGAAAQTLNSALSRVPTVNPEAGNTLVWRSQDEVLQGRVKLN